jgi:hypothetical protein
LAIMISSGKSGSHLRLDSGALFEGVLKASDFASIAARPDMNSPVASLTAARPVDARVAPAMIPDLPRSIGISSAVDLLALTPARPSVTSVTDRGWVGNPDTGRTVWMRYRSFSDSSNDVLISQGARGTGPSLAFPGEVDVGTIRQNLGDPSTSIYSISTFSPAALGSSGTAATASPQVTSVTDRGWVGNPRNGRVVWVRYRSFDDSSNDVLISQGARGTGLSQAFPGEVDVGTIRDNLANRSSSIYAISTFSPAALASTRPASAAPTVVSYADRGWVGTPQNDRRVWVRDRSLSDGSTDTLVSQGQRGTGASLAFDGKVGTVTISENLGNPSTSVYRLASAQRSSTASELPLDGLGRAGQPMDITDPARISEIARTLQPQRYAISLETQLGEDVTFGNVTIPASAKAKIQFSVPSTSFENGISQENLPAILSTGAVALTLEAAGQPALKITYDFRSNSFSVAQETRHISDIKLMGGIAKISWKDSMQATASPTGVGFQQGTGVTATLYVAGKDSVFSTLASLVGGALTIAQGASVVAAIPTGGASLAGVSLMQVLKRVLTEAISNGRLAIEAGYPATVSVVAGGGMRLQIGNNRVDLGAIGNELLRYMPIWTP